MPPLQDVGEIVVEKDIINTEPFLANDPIWLALRLCEPLKLGRGTPRR
jgi:hypothetical protein